MIQMPRFLSIFFILLYSYLIILFCFLTFLFKLVSESLDIS